MTDARTHPAWSAFEAAQPANAAALIIDIEGGYIDVLDVIRARATWRDFRAGYAAGMEAAAKICEGVGPQKYPEKLISEAYAAAIRAAKEHGGSRA